MAGGEASPMRARIPVTRTAVGQTAVRLAVRSQQLDLASSSFFLSFLFFFFFSAQNPALRVWRLQGRRASVQGVSRARDCAASEVSLSPSGRKVRGSMSPISGFVQRHFHVCGGFFLTLHTLFEKKNKTVTSHCLAVAVTAG